MASEETTNVQLVLTLAGGGTALSDPITVHDADIDGTTMTELVNICRTFTTVDTLRMSVKGAGVWFNPAHIVSAHIVKAGSR